MLRKFSKETLICQNLKQSITLLVMLHQEPEMALNKSNLPNHSTWVDNSTRVYKYFRVSRIFTGICSQTTHKYSQFRVEILILLIICSNEAQAWKKTERERERFTGETRGETAANRGTGERREKLLASFKERNHGGNVEEKQTNPFDCIRAVRRNVSKKNKPDGISF